MPPIRHALVLSVLLAFALFAAVVFMWAAVVGTVRLGEED